MANLNVDEQATRDKQLKPSFDAVSGKWKNGGYVPAKIESIEVVDYDFKTGEFAGQKVPKILFHFCNNNAKDVRAVYTFGLSIPASKKYAIQGNKNSDLVPREVTEIEKEIQEVYRKLKHMLDAFAGKANYRALNTLPKTLATTLLNLPEFGDAAARIEAFGKFFHFFADWMNGTYLVDPKKDKVRLPVYQTADGKSIPIWMILMPVETSNKKGYKYEFPLYTGTGFIECITIAADGASLNPPSIIEIKDLTKLAIPARVTVAQGANGPAAGAAPVSGAAPKGALNVDDLL